MAGKAKSGGKTLRVRTTRNIAGHPPEGTVFEVEDGRTVQGLLAHGSYEETTDALTDAPPVGVSEAASWSPHARAEAVGETPGGE